MKIRTQSRISTLLFGISLLAVIVTVTWTERRVNHTENQQEIAQRIAHEAGELLYLAQDYMMYREDRQLDQWKSRFAVLSAKVDRLHPKGQVQEWLIRKIKSGEEWLKEAFGTWEGVYRNRSQDNLLSLDPIFLEVSWSRVNNQVRALASDASRLLHELNIDTDRAKQNNISVIYAVILLFGVQLIIHFIVHRRLIDSIRRLHAGTRVIGSGDFDFSIQEEKDDEIGELSCAFNSMAAKLKTITAKKTDLEQQIIERQSAEEALQQSNKVLESQAKQLQALSVERIEAEEQERQRIAELLHGDLQQMLAAARLQLDRACRTLPSEPKLVDVRRMLEGSIEKTRRLAYELSPPVLDHLGLSAALRWLARQMVNQFGLNVDLDCDESQQVERSPRKVFIFHAVQELLFNVAKYSGTKNASVFLSASGDNFNLIVSDQGQGFDTAILDSANLPPEGFGLLSIRERAKYAGGSFEIESVPGGGSRFTLRIPSRITTVDALKQEVDTWSSYLSADNETSASGERVRVMIVDDHEVMRAGLVELMAVYPDIHVVGEASNGREAIERVRQLKPKVVVMDISMPEMDGVEATRRIKEGQPDIRVIGLSMYADEEIKQRMCEAGAETSLEKTVASDELLNAIRGGVGCETL